MASFFKIQVYVPEEMICFCSQNSLVVGKAVRCLHGQKVALRSGRTFEFTPIAEKFRLFYKIPQWK